MIPTCDVLFVEAGQLRHRFDDLSPVVPIAAYRVGGEGERPETRTRPQLDRLLHV